MCDAHPKECLNDHIRHHLTGAKLNNDLDKIRCLCPVHDDREPSLGISVGDTGKVIWRCFKGCDILAVRRALINAGVDADCLPIPRQQQQEALDEVRAILVSETKEDTLVRLVALARVDGFRKLPKGAKLLVLGRLIGISRSQTFDWAKKWRERSASTPNNRPSQPENGVVNSRTSERRGGAHRKSGNLDSVRKPGPQKVRKPGLVPPPRQSQSDCQIGSDATYPNNAA